VCVSLCTIVVQNTAQNSSDIFPLILQIITIAQMMRSGGEGATTTTTSIVTTFSCYVSVLLSSVTLSCVACPERPSFGITGATSTVSSITRSTIAWSTSRLMEEETLTELISSCFWRDYTAITSYNLSSYISYVVMCSLGLFMMHWIFVQFSFLGFRKSIWPVKNWVIRCWCGYLSEVRCKWLAYGPPYATAVWLCLALLKY